MTPWLDYAESQIGIKEMKGTSHNATILGYLETTTLGNWAKSRDETAWCSAFVNACFERSLGPGTGTGSALARSWMTWGQKVDPAEWELGDVCGVRHKRKKNYHVGFPYRIAKRHVLLLGGNQSDQVCFSRYPFRRWEIVAVRRVP